MRCRKISGIYCIRNKVTKKGYTGRSVNIAHRWRDHIAGRKSSRYLQNAIGKYGIKNFIFIVLEECNEESLVELEQKYLDMDDASINGYNLSKISIGNTVSESRKRYLSKSMSGSGNHFYGKKHTEEAKKKISLAHKGRKLSKDHRRKISRNMPPRKGSDHPMYGRKHTKEARERISKFNMGKKITEEHKKRISKARTGIKMPPQSEEAKRKISKALKGKRKPVRTLAHRRALSKARKGVKSGPCSEETKRKISEANNGEKNGMFGETPWNKGKTGLLSKATLRKMSKAKKAVIAKNSVFGYWKVLEEGPLSKHGQTRYWCVCQCGRKSLIPATRLQTGRSKGCRSCRARDGNLGRRLK